jgi:hypothetical protein
MNWILSKIAQFAIGNKLVSAFAWTHNKLDGRRSEIILGIMALVYGLKYAGIVPSEAANTIWVSLSPLLSATLADKASKVKAQIESIVPEPKEEKPA